MRTPTNAASDAAKTKLRKHLEDAFEHQADKMAHLREGMFQGMGDGEVAQEIEPQRRHAQSPVGRNRHVQFLRFLPERIELGPTVKSPCGRDGGQYSSDHAKIVDRSAKLFDGFGYILHRQQGDTD